MNMDQVDKAERKLEYLQKRELERQINKQCRKDDQLKIDAKNETIDYFEETFKEKEQEILILLKDAPDISKVKLPTHFDNISKQILLLQKYIATSNLFLRNYDIQKYQKNIQELSMQLKLMETKLIPKKKFGFTKKKEPPLLTKVDQQHDQVDSMPKMNGNKIRQETSLDDNFCGIRNETNQNLQLQPADIFKKDITLNNLLNCTVRIHGAPSTLHMSNLQDCKIFVGPVSTSIFAANCTDCTMFLSCQQLRLHSSERIDIYLHVTSRAIMEDCNGIRIAPYTYFYDGIEADYNAAGLDRQINNWQCIDDFNWLNTEKPSPHWSLMESDNRST